jgi:hypothetical protein
MRQERKAAETQVRSCWRKGTVIGTRTEARRFKSTQAGRR